MDSQSTEHKQGTRPLGFLRWFLAVASLFLIYIFASGPAIRLGDEGVVPSRLVDVIYDPLNSFCFAHETTSRTYCWYLKLWGHEIIPLSPRPVIYDPVREF